MTFVLRGSHGKFPRQMMSECGFKKRQMFAGVRWENPSGQRSAKPHVEDIQVIGCHWPTMLRPLPSG